MGGQVYFLLEVHHETSKGLRVSHPAQPDLGQFWLPKSQVTQLEEVQDGIFEFALRPWLVREKNLVPVPLGSSPNE